MLASWGLVHQHIRQHGQAQGLGPGPHRFRRAASVISTVLHVYKSMKLVAQGIAIDRELARSRAALR